MSFATVTPSFVTSGDPNFRLNTTLRPWGPKVTLTVSARAFTPFSIAVRASSRYLNSFAAITYLLLIMRSDLRVKKRISTLYRRVLDDSETTRRGSRGDQVPPIRW